MKLRSAPYHVLLHSLLCAAGATATEIFGGEKAEAHRYPYGVSLQSDEGTPFCGGSLVAPDVVLTAAHCQRGKKNWLGRTVLSYKAVVGRQNLDEDEGGEYYAVKEVLHPQYSIAGDGGVIPITPTLGSLRIDNDFMLVFLSNPVTENHGTPIGLNANASVPALRDGLEVVGWGDTAIGSKFVPSRTLLSARGHAISNADCASRRGSTVTYEGAITTNELCLTEHDRELNGGLHQGICSGDSGGPLVVRGERPRDDLQVGVVSWGPCGSNKELPGVFARVSSQHEWIRGEVCRGSAGPPSSFGCGPVKKSSVLVVVVAAILAILASFVLSVALVSLIRNIRRRRHQRLQQEHPALLGDTSPPERDYFFT